MTSVDSLLGLAADTLADLQRIDELYAWEPHAFQRPPEGSWSTWFVMAGRGSGKTRAAAEYVHRRVRFTAADRRYTRHADPAEHVTLIAPTSAAARDVMVLGESGLQAVADRLAIRFRYKSSWGHVEWPDYGVKGILFSAEEPRSLRGPQSDLVWAEEVASWKDAYRGDVLDSTWNNMSMGLRIGRHPVCVATSTPKPLRLIVELVERARRGEGVAVTTGSTYDNRANLAASFFDQLTRHEGTRIGRQELHAELLVDAEGALWRRDWIERDRVLRGDWWEDWLEYYVADPEVLANVLGSARVVRQVAGGLAESPPGPLPDMAKMVVAVDPSVSTAASADETGVIVAGLGRDGRSYVFDDLSDTMPPSAWARQAIGAYQRWLADKVVAEKNNGGELVRMTLRQYDANVPVTLVWASRGKATRAEPVAALYDERKVSHVGSFPTLEDELCSWEPTLPWSPGRLDALVWALAELNDISPANKGSRQFYSQ